MSATELIQKTVLENWKETGNPLGYDKMLHALGHWPGGYRIDADEIDKALRELVTFSDLRLERHEEVLVGDVDYYAPGLEGGAVA